MGWAATLSSVCAFSQYTCTREDTKPVLGNQEQPWQIFPRCRKPFSHKPNNLILPICKTIRAKIYQEDKLNHCKRDVGFIWSQAPKEETTHTSALVRGVAYERVSLSSGWDKRDKTDTYSCPLDHQRHIHVSAIQALNRQLTSSCKFIHLHMVGALCEQQMI